MGWDGMGVRNGKGRGVMGRSRFVLTGIGIISPLMGS